MNGAAAQQWHFAVGEEQRGPVDLTTLAGLAEEGVVTPDTLVWRPGLPDWAPAGDLPELADVLRQGPAGQFVAGAGAVLPYATPANRVAYAGFWLRFAAAFIDGVIVVVPVWLLFAAIRIAAGVPVFDDNPRGATAVLIELSESLFSLILGWLYEALLTSSARQATLGKMAVGIIVTDESGRQIGFGRATGRHFAKLISMILLMVGYIMAAFTERKQALHDMMAGTLVVRK